MFNNKILKRATSTTMVCLLTILLVMPVTVLSTAFITEVVSTESTSDSVSPSLAVDIDGNVHVASNAWSDYGGSGVDYDIFYKAKINGVWTATEVVSTESNLDTQVPSLAIDPDGNVHVAWQDYADYLGSGGDGYILYKNMVPSITLTDLMTRIDALESKIDHIEWKLDILLERLGIVGGLMLPTEGLKLVIDLFINNAATMVVGILLLIGFSLLMRRVKKKV